MTLEARVAALVSRLAGGARDDAARDALLVEALSRQAETVAPYARLVRARGRGRCPADFPALPTDVFRFARVAAHPPERDVRVFRTSGTTHGERGSHAFADLALYDLAAHAGGAYALFPDLAPGETMRLVVVAPDPRTTPDSSLGHMLGLFADRFGDGHATWALGESTLDVAGALAALSRAEHDGARVALCGTSFGLVHLDDALGARRFALPAGSRIMQTGGFKGRTRTLDADAMLAMLVARYGVPAPYVVAEYGMTELSSQLWETTLREAVRGEPACARRFRVPGWVRATPVDPETLAPVPNGAVGVLRIDDLANLSSVCAVQTSDLARSVAHDAIELVGRAPGAVPRGCSLATEEALG